MRKSQIRHWLVASHFWVRAGSRRGRGDALYVCAWGSGDGRGGLVSTGWRVGGHAAGDFWCSGRGDGEEVVEDLEEPLVMGGCL